jgi:hypothetical protein
MGSEKGKRGRPGGPSGQQNGGAKNNGAAAGGQKAARTPSAATAGAGARGGASNSAALRHVSPIPLRESSEVRFWVVGWWDGYVWGHNVNVITNQPNHTPSNTHEYQFQDNKGGELPLIRHGENGALVLVDGSVHQGFSFGATVPIAGEVVFNTGM